MGHDEKKPNVLQYKSYNMLKQCFSTFFLQIGTKKLYDKRFKIYSGKYFIIIEI